MKYQFRFATILQLRRRQRDEAGAAVGQANEAIGRIDQQCEALQLERQRLRQRDADHRVGRLSVDSLLAGGRYDIQLLADLHSLGQTRLELLQELERRQQKLVDAEAEVKRFERLEEHDRKQHQAIVLKRQQAELDDAAARGYSLTRKR